ncbi:MAG TPA: DUF11 domain-containing protein [Anaerolineae bacterium]|mgnify:CR=1 FL=1|nr:DUF11 domain-containing protein [Anaerolineae bacterium]
MAVTKLSLPKSFVLRPRLVILSIALIITLVMTSEVWAEIVVPPNDNIFIQTSGEQAGIGVGDYYSDLEGDDLHHLVEINIPCVANQTYTVELFDPEVYDAGDPGAPTETVDDEWRNEGDITNFVLRSPANVELVIASFPSFTTTDTAPPVHDSWVAFGTITLPDNPTPGQTCGVYTIETWTGDEDESNPSVNNDDNAWKYRVRGGAVDVDEDEDFAPNLGPDGSPGTGDEVTLGIQRLSFQHNTSAAQSFYWFVDDDSDRLWIGRNFDMDVDTVLCPGGVDSCNLQYISPSGQTTAATISGNAEWNPPEDNSSDRNEGDPFSDIEPGLWRANVTIPVDNQYIIEIENDGKPIFLAPPDLPNVLINKDDGVEVVTSPGVTTYTLTITNTGPGAAMPLPDAPEVTDTLPPGMTFVACEVLPPLEGTCTGVAPDRVEFELVGQSTPRPSGAPIPAYLPGANSGLQNIGQLLVVAAIAPGLPNSTVFTNVVQVDWTDIDRNNYRPNTDTDIDRMQPGLDLQILKDHQQAVVRPGDLLTYTLTISNVGESIATGVVVTDTLPANTSFVSASDGGIFADGQISWAIGTLNAGDGLLRTVTVRLNNPFPAGVTSVTNVAVVSDDRTHGPDRNPGNNRDDDTTPIQIVDPIITKEVNVALVRPGDPVQYAVIISNPSSRSTASATGVTVVDEMPLEMDLLSYTVTTSPPGLAIDPVIVTTNIVSTVGHPSGITQTLASTITVPIPELGLDQSVRLDIKARANGLAGPPPLTIRNLAVLGYNEGPPKDATTTVEVPSTPQQNPPKRDDSDDDDDDDESPPAPSSVPAPSIQPPAPPPTPALPVLFLPETGRRTASAGSWTISRVETSIFGIGGLALAGAGAWVVVWSRSKRRRKG